MPNYHNDFKYSDRHVSVQAIMPHFEVYEQHSDAIKPISKAVHDLAVEMIENLEDGPELTAGLRRLLEAKDCFVRQRVVDNSFVG